ncbi:MAG TPA: SDR family NAD(P)-dependent oxidoreductase, partial [Opitutus sp.]|nr:SDR family NAD(P)-dependent oxidoreductase [Opitutus sp.]
RIDVWINNAGVGLFGRFTHADMEMHRRVVETNLFGAMNGAAAVLPYFMEQGRGTMITNISVGAFAPVPFAAAYTAGKFGLRGFMAALRQEFADAPGIRLCSVFPAIVDTPGFAHGANVSGARMQPKWMVFPPEKVAATMVDLAMRPRAEVCVGWPARLAKAGYGLAPMAVEKATGTAFRAYMKRAESAERTTGNLFSPSTEPMQPSGGLRGGESDFSARTGSARNKQRSRALTWAGIAGGGAALIAAALLVRRQAGPHGRRRRSDSAEATRREEVEGWRRTEEAAQLSGV